jgi:hypothetical protein
VLHDIHNRALKRATEILGSEEKLRTFLGASELDLSSWMSATEVDYTAWISQKELPRNIFLRLVDIITDEDVRRVAGVAGR